DCPTPMGRTAKRWPSSTVCGRTQGPVGNAITSPASSRRTAIATLSPGEGSRATESKSRIALAMGHSETGGCPLSSAGTGRGIGRRIGSVTQNSRSIRSAAPVARPEHGDHRPVGGSEIDIIDGGERYPLERDMLVRVRREAVGRQRTDERQHPNPGRAVIVGVRGEGGYHQDIAPQFLADFADKGNGRRFSRL